MGLETVAYISDLVATNPPNTDPKSQGAAHLRNIKVGLLNSFPLIAGPVSASHEDLSAISSINPGTLPAVNGSNITNLNASALASGTVADARLSSNVPLKNAANTFTSTQTISTAGTGQLVVERSNTNANANIEYRTTGGSVWAGNNANAFRIGPSSNLTFGSSWASFAADGIFLNGVNVNDYARLSQSNTFTGADQRANASNAAFRATNPGGVDVRVQAVDSGTVGRVGTQSAHALRFITGGTERAGISASGVLTYGGIEVGYRGLPTWSTGDINGKVRHLAGNTALSTGYAEGTTFVLYNNSGSNITLSQGSGLTLRLGGTTSTGNRILLPRGFATVYAVSTTEYVVTGHVT